MSHKERLGCLNFAPEISFSHLKANFKNIGHSSELMSTIVAICHQSVLAPSSYSPSQHLDWSIPSITTWRDS